MGYGIGRFDLLLLGAAALVAFLLLGPVLLIPLHVPLGYNEGWNAYLAARAVGLAPGPLYPPADTLVFDNYPPLSFYVVGAFGRWVTGDLVVAGRIVALASLLASAALLCACTVRLGGSRRGGVTAALLLLLYAGTFFRGYTAVDEPQWLGHALMLGGLAVLLRGHVAGRYPAGRVVTAALLMALGGFVKHSLVGLPLAVTIWLVLARPRTAAIWLAGATGAVAAGVALTGLLHGRAAFADILLHHRVFKAVRAGLAVKRMLPLLPLMLVAALAWRRRAPDDPAMRFAGLFVVVALAVSVVERTGEGVNYNAYFEATVALCLMAGLAVSRAGRPAQAGGIAAPPALLAGLAALALLVTLPEQLGRGWHDIAGRGARERAWRPFIAEIAAAPGLVGCQDLSVCYWAGKPYVVDVFNLNQSLLTGGSIARFDRLARTHGFGLFEYGGGSFRGLVPRAGDRMLQDLLDRGYAPVAIDPDGNVMMAPGRQGALPADPIEGQGPALDPLKAKP